MQIMMKFNVSKLVLCVGLCFAFAYAGSTYTPVPGSEWYYHLLNKPSWNPPDWLFPPAWTFFFLLMSIALFNLVVRPWSDKPKILDALLAFGVQLLLNLGWSAAFFGLHSPLLALVVIVLLWFVILETIVKFRAVSPISGYLLIPYLLWVTFAAALNITIVQLN